MILEVLNFQNWEGKNHQILSLGFQCVSKI
jgi:hypothetical protein